MANNTSDTIIDTGAASVSEMTAPHAGTNVKFTPEVWAEGEATMPRPQAPSAGPVPVRNGARISAGTAAQSTAGPKIVRNGTVLERAAAGEAAVARDGAVAFKAASGAAPIASKLGSAFRVAGKVAVPLAVIGTGLQAYSAVKKKDGHEAVKAVGGGAAAIAGFGLGTGVGTTVGAVGGATLGAIVGTFAIPIPVVGTLIGAAIGGAVGTPLGFLAGGIITSMAAGWAGGKAADFVAGGAVHTFLNRNTPAPVQQAEPPKTARSSYPEFDNPDATQGHVAALQKNNLQLGR